MTKPEVTVTVENPSLQDLQEETQPIPQAETVIAAAVETGKAQQAAESAAEEATDSAAKAKAFLAEIKEAIRPQMEEISERLANLEAMEEEEAEEAEASITAAEEEGIPTIVSAEIVTLDEPPKLPESTQAKQSAPLPEKHGNGGFLRKIFLNQ